MHRTTPPTNPPGVAAIEADPHVPIIRITRDFQATPAQLLRAHTDPALYARWVGPDASDVHIVEWDARSGGCWKYTDREHVFRGCFHLVRPGRIVQTFTWEGMPEEVALESLMFVDRGDGLTGLIAESLTYSFEKRDAWLRSGMEVGVNDGYAKLDALLAAGAV